MIRVLVADDQVLVRAGLRAILEGEVDIEVVGEAGDGQEAIARARVLAPDVILMDIRMPTMDGLEAARHLCAAAAPPRIVILTTFDLDEYVYEALRAGASGFLVKDAPADDLIRAVRVAASGDAILAPSVTRRLIARFSGRHALPSSADIASLTEREREVLLLVARGLSNQEVAKKLFLSETTVKTHVAHMLDKLGLRDRVQAVVLAYEMGVVEPRVS
ncbi:MAG: response regulator [Candidatus Dormibacteria bacterium]